MPSQLLKDLLSDIDKLANIKHQNPKYLLKKIVSLIAKRLKSAVCSIYLYREEKKLLFLVATTGLNLKGRGIILKENEGIAGQSIKEGKIVNTQKGSKHPGFKPIKNINEEKYDIYLALPIIVHKRKIGVLVLQRNQDQYFTQEDELTLRVVISEINGIIDLSKDIIIAERHFQGATPKQSAINGVIKGVSASKGLAWGFSLVFSGFRSILDYKDKHFYHQYTHKDFLHSLQKTIKELQKLQKQLKDNLTESASIIFFGHQLILKDQAFKKEIISLIASGMNPPEAVIKIASKYIELFSHSDSEFIAEKTQDMEDISLRLLGNLLSQKDNPVDFKNKIVITEMLYPSDLLSLKSKKAKGVIMFGGGVTAHVSLIARSLNLPMILVDNRDVFKIDTKSEILLDGYSGNIHIKPHKNTVKQIKASIEKHVSEEEIITQVKEKSFTKDGRSVHLSANINLLLDLKSATLFKAEGVGLYRTEFPFMIRNDFPTEEEQYSIYRSPFIAFPDKPVTIRTLDIGGDKMLSHYTHVKEANPFLGLRSIRFTLKHEDIFITQMRAILRAGYGSQLQIMFPMISSIEELEQAKELLYQCLDELDKEKREYNKNPKIGIMVEIPSAVEIIQDLAELCDFFSIGTNDLIQYLLAVDRTNEKVASYYNAYHPSVIRSIGRIAKVAKSKKIDLSICGDIASQIVFLPYFIGLGINHFSIDPKEIHLVQKALLKIDYLESKALANEILELKKIEDIENKLKNLLYLNSDQKSEDWKR